MMAFRVRVLHSLILGLVGLTFILYSSYYSNPVQVYHLEDSAVNSTKLNPVSPASQSLQEMTQAQVSLLATDNTSIVLPTAGRNTSTQAEVKSPEKPHSPKNKNNVQVIPQKVKNSESKNASLGILTEHLYESGHDIPNVELCPDLGQKLRLLVAITSAPHHQEARMAIRQTWGHYGQRRDVAVGFLLGTANKPELDTSVKAEADLYGDIIRSRFIDSYDNLTLKTVSLTEWVDNFCTRVRFVLKTDDDMFINMPRLLSFIEEHFNQKRIIYGRLARKWKPIRNSRSKYFVSVRQFSPPIFPDFVTGPAYLLSGDIMHDLYTHSLRRNYLKLEDVYTTGIVAEAISVKRVHINEFLNKRIPLNVCNIKKSISIHMVKYHEQFDLWKKLLDGRSKCK